MKKRIMSLLLAAALCFALAAPVMAEDNIVEYPVEGGVIKFNMDTGAVTGYEGDITSAVIPERINGVTVTEIGEAALRWNNNLKSVTLPDTVTQIKRNAFNGDRGLERINFPSGLTYIGYQAFYLCESLTGVTLPEGMETIEESSFALTGLTGITIPRSVTSIGEYAFWGAELTSLTIPDTVLSIGKNAFQECPLESVVIGKGVKELPSSVFRGCDALTDITLPDTLETIQDWAFLYCDGLTSFTVPAGVSYVDPRAFENCENLANIYVAPGSGHYTSLDGVLYSKDMTEVCIYPLCRTSSFYEIPEGVTRIGPFAFAYHEELNTVAVPDSVTSVGENAFHFCKNLTHLSFANATDYGTYMLEQSGLGSFVFPRGTVKSGYGQCANSNQMTAVVIPISLTGIQDMLAGSGLTDIYYEGSASDWSAIGIGHIYGSNNFENVRFHYNAYDEGAALYSPLAGFADVYAADYYSDAVVWAKDNGVTVGMTERVFGAYNSVTRGQAVTFLWRAMGEPEPSGSYNPFVDVSASDYYYKAVLWAVENGITAGTDETHFTPAQTCSRAHITTFLSRTRGNPIAGGDWAAQAEAWARSRGLLDGVPGTYAAADDCPRADVVYYLWRELA